MNGSQWNALKYTFCLVQQVFWSSKCENINRKRLRSITINFCINNKIREVSYKIVHRIYPVWSYFLNVSIWILRCEFCGNAKIICNSCFLIVFIRKCFGWMFQISFSKLFENMHTNWAVWCCIYLFILFFSSSFFVQDNVDSKSMMCFLIQLFILLGKNHIHVEKGARAKPSFEHYIKQRLKQTVHTPDQLVAIVNFGRHKHHNKKRSTMCVWCLPYV